MGVFHLKNKIKLSEINENTKIPESDHSITEDGIFYQFEYVQDEEILKEYDVKPGTWTISKSISGMFLNRTEFVKDKILDTFVHTKNITDKIDCFFNNLHIYKEEGFEVPKRAMMLFGPPGSGKTTSLSKISSNYVKDNKTAVIIWPTDKFEAHTVKDFIQRFNYVDGVEKIILIIEDIGGVEIDQVRLKSDPSLLSLLDNQEKTFKIATMIIATTNHPEIFLGNLTNRPGRFDDKVEVGFPSKEDRVKLLEFFYKKPLTEELINLIKEEKYKEFSPAHIKEAIIRTRIYNKELKDTLVEISKEIEYFKKAFSKKESMGIGMYD